MSISTKGTLTFKICLINASFVESLVELKSKAPLYCTFSVQVKILN